MNTFLQKQTVISFAHKFIALLHSLMSGRQNQDSCVLKDASLACAHSLFKEPGKSVVHKLDLPPQL